MMLTVVLSFVKIKRFQTLLATSDPFGWMVVVLLYNRIDTQVWIHSTRKDRFALKSYFGTLGVI